MMAASADFIGKAFVYLGLFILPFLILRPSAGKRLISWLPSIGLFLLLMGHAVIADKWMPLEKERGNILMDFQLGPVPLFDVWLLEIPYIREAPKILWQIVTVAGAAGAALLLHHLLGAFRNIIQREKKSSGPRWTMVLLISPRCFT